MYVYMYEHINYVYLIKDCAQEFYCRHYSATLGSLYLYMYMYIVVHTYIYMYIYTNVHVHCTCIMHA